MTRDPGTLERLADDRADTGDYAGALVLREQAFAAWRACGEDRKAARLAAYQIAFDHYALFGNVAVAQGWLERAARLVADEGECVEAGWVALAGASYATDPGRTATLIALASRTARRFGDLDLELDALAHDGLSTVLRGGITDGLRKLDEAAVAAHAGEVASPTVAGEIYCHLLDACERTLDVRRAEEWQAVVRPLASRPAWAWAPAICRMHYGGILVAAGRWDEAETELQRALELYDASYRALRSAAVVRLAELRVRQGRLTQARELLAGQEDPDALRPQTRLDWSGADDEDRRRLVVRRLERALRQRPTTVLALPDLALLAEMQLACGDVAAAGDTVDIVASLDDADTVAALRGYADHATGLVSGAVFRLEAAVSAFATARLPLEEASARLSLGQAMCATDPTMAAAEAELAHRAFAELGALDQLDRAAALLRELGGPARTGPRRGDRLTDREQEVLALLAQGLSNPQIADRLFISRRTAAHHVSHVLAKLGVSNRSQAAAWASSHGRDRVR